MKPKLDKYYTSNKNIKFICEIISDNMPKNIKTILEPSAGDGRIIKKLKEFYPQKNFLSFDILPESSDIIKLDFLKKDIKKYIKTSKNDVLIIGNPPYGKNNKLAIEFIKKSSKYSDNIFFILSNSFKTNKYKKILNKYNLKIKKFWKIPEEYFEYKNKKYKLYTSFFWIVPYEQKNHSYFNENNKLNNILIYTKNKKEAKFLIRRVGGLAGKIIEENLDKYSLNSNYFIKECNNNIKDFLKNNFNKLNNIAKEKVISNPSLSKKDLEEFILKNYFKEKPSS